MIYVSQGHEDGIGLEAFIKAIIQLPQHITRKFELHANIEALNKSLNSLKLPMQKDQDRIYIGGQEILFKNVKKEKGPLSSASLRQVLGHIKESDILVTLPTSKDQLIFNGENCSGHTDFFRKYYSDHNITMLFKGVHSYLLLLTDHIPLKDVPTAINRELISKKCSYAIDGINRFFGKVEEVIFSGINPHAGENGLLGHEDKVIAKYIEHQKQKGKIKYVGPIPGDTMHFHTNHSTEQLFVCAYHDQGLSSFKEKNGLLGINITFGLPFLRFSVDHGTAFELYGKNMADASGCLFVLKEAYKVSTR